MAIVLALMAATCFAIGTVLQQKGTLSTDAGGEDARFLAQILREPVWLCGAAIQGAGWVFQGAALDRGPLVVVQAFTTLSLVIALPLGVRWTGQQVGRVTSWPRAPWSWAWWYSWSAGRRQRRRRCPGAAAWWSAGILAVVLIGAIAVARPRPSWRHARRALRHAAGVGFALQAAVTKQFVGELGQGVVHLLARGRPTC